MTSTQEIVLENKVDAGIVCIADRQTKGKGRGENVWESPLGALMFSFRSGFPGKDGKHLPFFQYLVSIALIRAINGMKECAGLDVKIKWPNDVYANGKIKIGGILCQSHHEGGRFIVTTGIGLNVNNDKPTTCLSALVSQKEQAPVVLRRELILANFFNSFDSLYDAFLNGNGDGQPSFLPFLDEYHSSWLHSGQVVHADGDLSRELVIEGISPDTGALLAKDVKSNQSFELMPDGNRLDFFNGLISRKVY